MAASLPAEREARFWAGAEEDLRRQLDVSVRGKRDELGQAAQVRDPE